MRLAFYDFDGTLFRSPEPVKGWEPAKWYTSIESLSPPHVPLRPSMDWWVIPVVASFRQDLSDPDCYTVVITGRMREVYAKRISQLLLNRGLVPDEIHLREEKDVTRKYKKACLRDILRRKPAITKVRGWEDKPYDLAEFKNFVEQQGVPFEAIYVPSQTR